MSVSNSGCQVAFYWEAKRSPVTSAFGCVEISWKTLRYDEFTSAASRGTIPSGFTLRLCCFQCSRVWLGVDSAVLTHVTISRWRWASATFKKKKKKSCNSSENRAAPLTRWHKPPTEREGEALKKTWPGLQIDHGVISVQALPGRVNEAFFFFFTVHASWHQRRLVLMRVHRQGRACPTLPGAQTWQLFRDYSRGQIKLVRLVLGARLKSLSWQFCDFNGATVQITRRQAAR